MKIINIILIVSLFLSNNVFANSNQLQQGEESLSTVSVLKEFIPLNNLLLSMHT